jgi:hypothetical protein
MVPYVFTGAGRNKEQLVKELIAVCSEDSTQCTVIPSGGDMTVFFIFKKVNVN